MFQGFQFQLFICQEDLNLRTTIPQHLCPAVGFPNPSVRDATTVGSDAPEMENMQWPYSLW